MKSLKQNLLDRFYGMHKMSYGVYKVEFLFGNIIRTGITMNSQLYDRVTDGRDTLTLADLKELRDIAKYK